MVAPKEKTLLEETFATVMIREDGILSVTMRGFLKPEQADKVSSAILSAVTERKLKLILINQRDLKVLSREIQNHFIGHIAKIDSYISRVAIIQPDDVFAVAGIKAIQNNVQARKDKIFTNDREAVEWLLQAR